MTEQHGSEAGYRYHRKAKEQACGHCIWAHRQYNKDREKEVREVRAARPTPPPAVVHGTPQALARHAAASAPVCEVCLTAACNWERAQAARYLRQLRSA